jgi:signal transduction histidine kinase
LLRSLDAPGGGGSSSDDGPGSVADSLSRACRWVLVGIAVVAVVLGLLDVLILLILRPPSLRYGAGERAVTTADAAMARRESALRGYLLTRDAGLLAGYRQATGSLAQQDALAAHHLGADPLVAGLLQAMRRAQDDWTTQWAAPAIDALPADAAATLTSLEQGRVLFEAYRASERALVDRLEREEAILSARSGSSLVLMLAVIALAGSSLMVITVAERRRLRSILLGPLSEILVTTDRIANHDLGARAHVEGPGEFRHIAGAVNEMASGLQSFQDRLAEENEQILSEMQSRVALEERTLLARELHDSISQLLFSLTLQTRAAELTLQKEGLDPKGSLARHLSDMRELTNGALAEMRALIFELRPGALREEGLVAALRKQAAGVAARDGCGVEVEAPEDPIDVDPITEEQLYRIGQEALHNVVKHAGATLVRIRLVPPPATAVPGAPAGELVLEISDDGRGFDPAIPRPGHMGLQTMSQRARRIGGWLEVESTPGAGTTVRVRVTPRKVLE